LILQSYSQTAENISAGKLTKFVLYGNGPLTLHEITFLQHFTEKVTAPILKAVCLEEDMFRRHLAPADENTEVLTLTEGDYTIGQLLAKYSSSLKCLTFERTPIIMKASPETLEQLRNLQLDEFSCNLALSSTAGRSSCTGYENVLKQQRHLHTLTINVRGIRTIPPSNVDWFYDTIEQCCGTLRNVHFDSISAIRAHDTELNNEVPQVIHDFHIYENCSQLQYLYVGVSIFHRLSQYHLVPGSLRNLQYIQPTIQTLFLMFDIFEEGERNAFIAKLPELINLRSFSAKGNREMPYRVNFDLIDSLIQLPKLRYFLLTGCFIEDFDTVRQFVSSSPELMEVMEVLPDCCAYTSWRNT
jgi:hypothetical protein